MNNTRGGGGGRGRGRGGGRQNYNQQQQAPFGQQQAFQGGFQPQQGYVQQTGYPIQQPQQFGGYPQQQQQQQQFPPNNSFQGGGGKKPPKIAQNVRYVANMHFNVAQVSRDPASPLSGFCLNLIPNPAGPTPKVQCFTCSVDGAMTEFNCDTGVWQKSRGIKLEGPTTCVLAVDTWIFVAYVAPSGFGAVKAYNLQNGREFTLQDYAGTQVQGAAHLAPVSTFAVGGTMLLTGGKDGQVKAWSFAGEDQGGWILFGCFASQQQEGEITAMKPFAKQGLLFTSTSLGGIKMWRLNEGTCLSTVPAAHQGPISAIDVLAVSDASFFVLTAGRDDLFIRLWSVTPAGALVPVHQVSTVPPANPNFPPRQHVPLTAMKIIPSVSKPEHHLYVGSNNGSINVYNLKSTTHFERLGVVDGHQRFAKVLGFDVVPTGPASQMMCAVLDNGNVNWFQLD